MIDSHSKPIFEATLQQEQHRERLMFRLGRGSMVWDGMLSVQDDV